MQMHRWQNHNFLSFIGLWWMVQYHILNSIGQWPMAHDGAHCHRAQSSSHDGAIVATILYAYFQRSMDVCPFTSFALNIWNFTERIIFVHKITWSQKMCICVLQNNIFSGLVGHWIIQFHSLGNSSFSTSLFMRTNKVTCLQWLVTCRFRVRFGSVLKFGFISFWLTFFNLKIVKGLNNGLLLI